MMTIIALRLDSKNCMQSTKMNAFFCGNCRATMEVQREKKNAMLPW
jgi:hypothetical protein